MNEGRATGMSTILVAQSEELMGKCLTKSSYLRAKQCHKRIWLKQNSSVTARSDSDSEKRRKREGVRITELAREFRGSGLLIDALEKEAALAATQEAISAGELRIFEAALFGDGSFARVDILERIDSGGWQIIEVKSSTEVKTEHLQDLAFQKYVAENSGLPIARCQLMHLNKECVYPDLSTLFVSEDISQQVNELQGGIRDELSAIRETITSPVEPDIHVSSHCNRPYRCSYADYCWTQIPKESIFSIPRLAKTKEEDLIRRGIIALSKVPNDFPLSEAQRRYVEVMKCGAPEINRESIRVKLKELKYPIHFFDIEADGPAIPKFQGMRPHDKLCFQFSCHILTEEGPLEHRDFLHSESTDPREHFIRALISTIHANGSVVVYYAPFEKPRLKELGEGFPQYKDALDSISARIWDQLDVIKQHFLHPGFCGSNSIKDVLPIIVPELSYKELTIQAGDQAATLWCEMLLLPQGQQRAEVEHALRKYCELDTTAMVRIHQHLASL